MWEGAGENKHACTSTNDEHCASPLHSQHRSMLAIKPSHQQRHAKRPALQQRYGQTVCSGGIVTHPSQSNYHKLERNVQKQVHMSQTVQGIKNPWGAAYPPTMPPSSSSSPNLSARSQRDCVRDSTGMGSLYVKRCCCASTRPWSIRVRASAVSPLIATPTCSSTSATFSMLLGSCNRVAREWRLFHHDSVRGLRLEH